MRLIFTAHTKARLFMPGKLAFGNNDHNEGLFVDPCVIPPPRRTRKKCWFDIDPSTNSQGLQKSVNFVKTTRGYGLGSFNHGRGQAPHPTYTNLRTALSNIPEA